MSCGFGTIRIAFWPRSVITWGVEVAEQLKGFSSSVCRCWRSQSASSRRLRIRRDDFGGDPRGPAQPTSESHLDGRQQRSARPRRRGAPLRPRRFAPSPALDLHQPRPGRSPAQSPSSSHLGTRRLHNTALTLHQIISFSYRQDRNSYSRSTHQAVQFFPPILTSFV